MGANINSITPILKEVYAPKIVEQLDNYSVTAKRLLKSSDNISQDHGGKYVSFPIHVGRNSGIGSRFELEALPAAGQQKYDGGRVGLKSAYGAIQVTGQSVAMSSSNPKAFAQVITEEVDGLARDLQRDFNRQLFGNGNGALGYFTAATTGTTATVAASRGIGVDDFVDIYDNTGAKTASGKRVLAVNNATKVVTFDSATAVVVGGFLTRAGSGTDPVKGNRELTGFNAIVSDTGVLYNIDPASQPVWSSSVLTANTDPLDAQMTLEVDNIYALGGSTDLIITTQAVRRKYVKELMTLRRTVNSTEHTGGFSAFKFVTDGPNGDIDIEIDLDCREGEMLFMNMKDVTLYRESPWSFLDRDGSMWKQVTTANGPLDAWRAENVQYHELAISRRNTHGKIKGITVP